MPDLSALYDILRADWLPAACVAGWAFLQFGDNLSFAGVGAKLKDLAGKAKAFVTRAPAEPELTVAQRADKHRKAALLSLRHLASSLPAEERTDALSVMDNADALNARVGAIAMA